jgi:hypothetical protein
MALRYIFIFDAAQSYMHLNPLFSLSGNASLPITAQGYGFCCVNIIAYMARVYCSVQLQFTLLGAFCVTIGFYDAKDFPPLFGRWRDAYTLRRFWGSLCFPLFPLIFDLQTNLASNDASCKSLKRAGSTMLISSFF